MPAGQTEAAEKPRGNRGRLWAALSLFLACALGAAVIGYLLRRSHRPFPANSEIERIEADVHVGGSGHRVRFEVPRSHWDAIFSSLLPASRDDHAMKWAGIGHLDLKLKNREPFLIELFIVSGDVGAFAAGPTSERRIYYRGGDSDALRQAIEAAFETSKEAEAAPGAGSMNRKNTHD